MYEIQEISLGNLSRLYQYAQNNIYGTKFNIKGFDYPWTLASYNWKADDKVLDVGASYSPFPCYLQEKFGCEVWAVDDFGLNVNDPYWTRSRSPQDYIQSHPQVKYVLERLGDPQKSSLPKNYFDVIYSISVLEHIPQAITPAVWKHMDLLLKPNGQMLHAVDINFPSNSGLKKVISGMAFDQYYRLTPKQMRIRYCYATPLAYVRLALDTLGVKFRIAKDLKIWNVVLNPDILTEGYENGLNRIVKDQIKDFQYQRVGTLLIKLRKTS